MSSRSNLEGALRTMLRERAGDIERVPAALATLLDDAAPATTVHEPRRHRWLLLAAAVLSVLAVAGASVGIATLADGRHAHPSAPTHGPAPAPTTSPSPDRSGPSVATQTTCTASLPTGWRDALAHGRLSLGAQDSFPVAITPDGELLVIRDFGHARDVVLVSRGGTVRPIYTVPDPDQHRVAAAIEGPNVLITLDNTPRAVQKWVPALTDVLVLNLDTGTTTTVIHVPPVANTLPVPTIFSAALFDGHVYWDQSPGNGSGTLIRDYDIATGTTRTLETGELSSPVATAGGVSWKPGLVNGVEARRTVQVPATLPTAVAAAVPAKLRATVVSDGSAYAWLDPTGGIGWWTPGAVRPLVTRVPGGPWSTISAVSGPYVVLGNDVVDVRSGAVATGDALNSLTGGVAITGAGGSILYGYTLPSGKGGPKIAVRIDTTRLPELHC